jgi:putative ABC transport system substrate-binding protein
VIDRRTFLLTAAALLAGMPNLARARPRPSSDGLFPQRIELTHESVELLRRILPRVQRVGLMHDADSAADQLHARQSLRLAEKIGVRFMPVGVRRGGDLERAFGILSAESADAVIVQASLSFAGIHGRIVQQAAASRLPALYGAPEFAEAGGLVSLSQERADRHFRPPMSAARLPKGAHPAELPIDQPIKFELIVNLRTAAALGIAIPQSVILRADRVIE